jgi:ubiquitin-conjugating enzyme E2 W
VKELNEIRSKGTPPGIDLLSAESMAEWIFTIAVLGEETIYRVRLSPLVHHLPSGIAVFLSPERAEKLADGQDEKFALKLVFGPRYPIESPIVRPQKYKRSSRWERRGKSA